MLQEISRYTQLFNDYTSQGSPEISTESTSPSSFVDLRIHSYRSAERTSSMSEELVQAKTNSPLNDLTEGKQVNQVLINQILGGLGFAACILHTYVKDGRFGKDRWILLCLKECFKMIMM